MATRTKRVAKPEPEAVADTADKAGPPAKRGAPPDPNAYPAEMRANVEVTIGSRTLLRATAHTTPAGLATAGVMVASVLFSTAVLVRALRRPPLA